jgi:hypothetical protein
MTEAAKTLHPTIILVSPPRTAETINTGAATAAASSPSPWLTLLAISSPGDWRCSGSSIGLVTRSS